jgi:Domain of Unknown Function (DUF928)
MNHLHPLTKLTLGIAFGLLLSFPDGLLLAQPSSTAPAPIPPSSGRPKRAAGGGSRGGCPPVEVPLTAIAPETALQTIAEQPTFWFYMPYIAAAGSKTTLSARFIIQLNGEHLTPPIPVQLPNTPGIIPVRLPASAQLAVNQSYQWFLEIDCNSPRESPIALEGTVQRIALASGTPPRTTTTQLLRQQAQGYSDRGLWLDALTTLAKLRHQAPQDDSLIADWQAVLKAINLEQLSEKPLLK